MKFPDQRSTMDQIDTLIRLATERGMYDAADWLRERVKLNHTRQTVYDSGFKAGATVGFERGLRRAQELARQMLPSGDCFAREFDQAIDAEAAKERT